MEKDKTKQWFIYMLRCSDDSFYVGITNNVDQRLKRHNEGKGAKYTRSRLPVVLVWSERCDSESIARKREVGIKKLSRVKKLELAKN